MKALIIVDMQKDFMPGGSLGTPGADFLVPIINGLMKKFPLVVATKDWHPQNHMSFAENSPGKKVGDIVRVEGLEQILWPTHCVEKTDGAEFVTGLDTNSVEKVFYKGVETNIDSYSTFFDNAKKRATGLGDYLREKGVEEIYVVGVATDYCVFYSVLDALKLGFQVFVIRDACAAINLSPNDEQEALGAMEKIGAKIIKSGEVA